MERIEHTGIIERIDEKHMTVRIQQISACAGCHAKSICSSADKEEKIVDIRNYIGTYRVGQWVRLTGTSSMGLQAVLLAYVLPLFLMIAAMYASQQWFFPQNEGLSALIALGSLAVYYPLLYLVRNPLQKKFVFEVSALPQMNEL